MVLDVGESSRRSGSGGFGTFWGLGGFWTFGVGRVWEGSGRWREFETFGVHWVRRIGCGAHRSWRIRRPAAARKSVLSELEPRARTKHPALLLIDLLLGCRFAAWMRTGDWRWLVCWRVGRGKQKARSGWTGLYGFKILRFAQDDSEALRMTVRHSG